MTTLQASFIVIAFNEGRTLERTLRSITAQEELDDYEILVIDDASTDDTVAVAERYAESDPSLRVVRQETNGGRGAARKLGVEAARGQLIATVDSDIVLPPDWYRTCRSELEDADAVGGIAVPDGDVAYLYRRFLLEPRPVPHIVGLTGNNALYRSSVFTAVQFDERLRNGEDVALGHAMDSAGLRVRVVDGLYVRHEESKSFAESIGWLFESGIGASRQLHRYRRPRPPDLVFAAFLASAGAGAILSRSDRPFLGPLLPVAYLTAASGAHVGTRFRLQRGRPGRFAGAVAADSALLLAYFAGRLIGHARPS